MSPRSTRLKMGLKVRSAAVLALAAGLAAGTLVAYSTPAQAAPTMSQIANQPAFASKSATGIPSGQTVTGQVALSSGDPAGLKVFIASTADPSSPNYRHYVTPSQFAQRYGASAAVLSSTESWLKSAGLSTSPSVGGLGVKFEGNVDQVQTAFATHLAVATSGPGNSSPTTPLMVPSALSSSVVGVVGLSQPKVRPNIVQRTKTPVSSTSPAHTPQLSAGVSGTLSSPCVEATQVPQQYGSTSYDGAQSAAFYHLDTEFTKGYVGSGVSVALVEFEPFAPSDISRFYKCYGLDNHLTTTQVSPRITQGSGSGEATLDVEAVAQSAPAASIHVYQSQANSDSQVLSEYQAIATDDTSQVVSTSWGLCEPYTDPGLIAAENGVFAQMAAQGQTVLAASGDTGSEGCYQVDSANKSLAVDDPASQPYVVAVGGVSVFGQTIDSSTTTVWNNCPAACADMGGGASGGGASATWPRSPWQPALAGTVGREVPDLAASADPAAGFSDYFGGGWQIFGGTSAATPVMAGMIALADQGCTAPAGLVTPKMYANPQDFVDIDQGTNDFGAMSSGSYPALVGYDMATGLGVPQAQELVPDLRAGASCQEPTPSPSPSPGPTVTGLSSPGSDLQGGQTVVVSGTELAGVTGVDMGQAEAQILSVSSTEVRVRVPAAPAPALVDVVVHTPTGQSPATSQDLYYYEAQDTVMQFQRGGWQADTSGQVYTFGDAGFYGSLSGSHLNGPVVSMAVTGDDRGYWLAAADGGVFAFGDAPFFGSAGGIHLNSPIVAMIVAPGDVGYWLVASDGGVFAYGAAGFHGSLGASHINKPIVAAMPARTGSGYWLVGADGGVFAFGDARYLGSTGAIHLNSPVVAAAATTAGAGYWLVASDGGVFAFGDAPFYGSAVESSTRPNTPFSAIGPVAPDTGYWLTTMDGQIYTIGTGFYVEATPWDMSPGRSNAMISLILESSPYATGPL